MKPCDGLLSPERLQNLSAGQGLRGFEGKKAGTEGKKPSQHAILPPRTPKDSSYGITNREKEESKGRIETENRKKVEEKIILY